jgi:hypothetical protein
MLIPDLKQVLLYQMQRLLVTVLGILHFFNWRQFEGTPRLQISTKYQLSYGVQVHVTGTGQGDGARSPTQRGMGEQP